MSLDKKNSINNILEEKRIFPKKREFSLHQKNLQKTQILVLKKNY